MKILQVTGERDFELQDTPIPEPGLGEVLLRIEAVTTCPQWDLHLRHNEPMFVGHQFHYPYTPGQPGHEATGTIEALGEGVTNLAIGQRVSAWRDPGHNKSGCYAQYVARSASDLIPVPEGLPYEATASVELAMCVGATILRIREMNVFSSRVIGITGLGPAGLIAAQMVRAEGASEVYGFDLSPQRREYALSFVDAAFDPRADLSSEFPARPSRPRLFTGIDCVGAKTSVEFLMDRTQDTVALFGVQREPYTFGLQHYMNLRLCGYPGHSREAADYAVDLIATGKLDLTPLVTHTLPLSRYGEGIDLLEHQKAIKVCFLPWE